MYDIHSKGEPIVDTILDSSTPSLNKFYNNSCIPLKKRSLRETIDPIDSLKSDDSHNPLTHKIYENTLFRHHQIHFLLLPHLLPHQIHQQQIYRTYIATNIILLDFFKEFGVVIDSIQKNMKILLCLLPQIAM